jgi:hypothetical protein
MDKITNQIINQARKGVAQDKFKNLNAKEISELTDKGLASFQAKFDADDPHYILASYEWQRRITIKQIGATKFAAYMGIAAALLGAIVGAFMAVYIGNEYKAENECSQSATESAGQKIDSPKMSSFKFK